MLTIRRSHERGQADHGWLHSQHTFSFASYYDPTQMGFRALRVINEDRVAPAAGFPTHGHRDMEIISYVLEGALEHKDSMGNGSVIRPGELQRMSAGTGVTHSEYNHDKVGTTRFLQIWIIPEAKGITPGYEQRAFPPQERAGKLRLVADRKGSNGALTIHQDARVFLGTFSEGAEDRLELPVGRHAYVHVARGQLTVNGERVETGDGVALSDESHLDLCGLAGDEPAEVLVFDLS